MSFENRDDTIDYIEFPVADMVATKTFYAAAFGWSFTDYGPHYCEFTDGRISGGFALSDTVATGGAMVVLYHHNLALAQNAVETAGGQITKALFDFPGGQRFEFADPNGHVLAVWRKI